MASYFFLSSNQFCDDVPSEVAALSAHFPSVTPSASPTYYEVAEENSIGTPCFLYTDQYTALSALYGSAGGGSWASKANWMNSSAGEGPCTGSWYGVTCTSGAVTSLLLQSNGLNGSLPTQIGLATTLSAHLDAYANTELAGSLPTEFGQLSELCAFALGSNNFVGSVNVPNCI
jgi:hypothetical protein